jgi:hypothetical protein
VYFWDWLKAQMIPALTKSYGGYATGFQTDMANDKQ